MNNKYYKLVNSIEGKIVGSVYPQIQHFAFKYDDDAPNSLYKIPNFKIPDFTPNLDGLKLHYRAKKTDFLSAAMLYRGWFLNEKVKNILEKYSLISHKFFPAKIYHKNEILTDYYGLVTEFDIMQYIDFEKTEFYAYHNSTQSIGETIKVSDGESYEKKYDEVADKGERTYQYILKHRPPIYLKPNFPKELDFFTMYIFITKPIISERLKNALEAENVTGVEYIEINEADHVVFE